MLWDGAEAKHEEYCHIPVNVIRNLVEGKKLLNQSNDIDESVA
jgi:hypothetical protein